MRTAVVVIVILSLAGCASSTSNPSSVPAPVADAEPEASGTLPRPWVATTTYPANASLGEISAWLQSEYARIGHADAAREAAGRPRESEGGSLGHCMIDNSPRADVLPVVEWTRLAKRCQEEMLHGTPEQQFEAILMLQDVRDATIGRPDISATFPSDYGPAVINLVASPDVKVRRFAASFAGNPCFTADPLAAAFHAGFRACRGELIAVLDADLQNDPAEIPMMVERLRATNAGLVQGDRSHARKDNMVRRVGSWVGRSVRRWLLGDVIRDTGCSLRVMKKELALKLPLEFRGMHRFIPITAKHLGYKVEEVRVTHRPRVAGETKYGFGIVQRALPGLIDLFAVRYMRTRRRPTTSVEVGAAPMNAPVGEPKTAAAREVVH